MAKKISRNEAYKAARELGLSSKAAQFVGSEKALNEAKRYVNDFGLEKANGVIVGTRSKSGSVKDVLTTQKEQNKLIKKLEQERIDKYGKVAGKLTRTERAELRKEFKNNTGKDAINKAKAKVVDHAARLTEWQKHQINRNNGKMLKEHQKLMQKFNAEKGLDPNHSYGYRVVGQMFKNGMTEKEAKTHVQKFLDRDNPRLIFKDTGSI